MKFTLERWACLESLVKGFQWFCSFCTQELFCSLSWCEESCFMAAEGVTALVVLYTSFHPAWSSGWSGVWIRLRAHVSLLPFPRQCQGRPGDFPASGKWAVRVGSLWGPCAPRAVRVGSLWGARAPRPGCCPGAAGCSHQAAYAGAILGHPFLAPVLYPVGKERWRRETPLLSLCVGPCGAVNQLFCCHLAQVCLLQGPENTWRGLGAPGLRTVAPLGLVSPGFPLRVGAPSLAPWTQTRTQAPSARAISWCCLPPSPRTLLCSRHALLTCCLHKRSGGFAFCVKCLERPVWKVL